MKILSESVFVSFLPTMPPRLKKKITRFKQVKFLRKIQYKKDETRKSFWGALFRRSLSNF